MITCFDIGGSWVKAACAESLNAINFLGRLETPREDFDAFVAAIDALARRSRAEPGSPIAVAITGVVDPQTGRIKCANIPCIDGRRLADELAQRLARPVRVANDADCYALAEAHAGAGRGHEVVFAAILGTGVGGGLVINGRIVSGAGGYAGEWGHGPILATRIEALGLDVPRFSCGCGQFGCADTVGGARGLERLCRHITGETLSSEAILDLWLDGAEVPGRIVRAYVALVADPLALVVNIIGPQTVPVGGGLSNCVPLIAALDTAVRARILRHTDGPLVVPGQCRDEPGLLGAAILAMGKARQ